jgi:L-histidine Nalpha-methyltransferase
MNRELDATLDLSGFAHEAFYNEAEGRIEIYLRSLRSQTAMVAGWRFMFAQGERIHTEYSYKYDGPTFAALVDGTGFNIGRTWTDDDSFFAVHYLVADSQTD